SQRLKRLNSQNIPVVIYSGATVVQEVEKSFSNQKVASSIPCRSVLEQDTEPLIAPGVQCAISVKCVYNSGGWWFLKVREEGLRTWLPLACLFCWWHKHVRYKLFQGVFVNYSRKQQAGIKLIQSHQCGTVVL